MSKKSIKKIVEYTKDEKLFLKKAKRITKQIKQSINTEVDEAILNKISKKQIITCLEAREKYKITPRNHKDTDLVMVFNGDVHLNEHLNKEWIIDQLNDMSWEGNMYGDIIIVGNLTVNGDVIDNDYLGLYVTNNLTCDYVYSENGMIEIKGDTHIKFGIYGVYNDGSFHTYGKIFAPYFIASDHDMPRQGEGDSIYIEGGDQEKVKHLYIGNKQGNYAGWGWNYFENPKKLISKKVKSTKNKRFYTDTFFDIVRKGENPFKEIK